MSKELITTNEKGALEKALNSGYFPGLNMEQAFAKLIYGRELGMKPVDSLRNIVIVKGNMTLSAVKMAELIKKSGKYTYKIPHHTDQKCIIEIYEKWDTGWELMGSSVFTIEDAKNAGLASKDVWQKYPRNMLFARAISNAAKSHCADIFGGTVYYTGELEESGVSVEEKVKPSAFEQKEPDRTYTIKSEKTRLIERKAKKDDEYGLNDDDSPFAESKVVEAKTIEMATAAQLKKFHASVNGYLKNLSKLNKIELKTGNEAKKQKIELVTELFKEQPFRDVSDRTSFESSNEFNKEEMRSLIDIIEVKNDELKQIIKEDKELLEKIVD